MRTTTDDLTKIPRADAAEAAAIGAMFYGEQYADEAIRLLKEQDFYQTRHRIIFRAIADLRGKHQMVDGVTLPDWLRKRELLDEIGGKLYLDDLVSAVPNPAGIAKYAEIILDSSQRRRLLQAAEDIKTYAMDTSMPITEVRGAAEEVVLNVADRQTGKGPRLLQQIASDVFNEREDALEANRVAGLRTGYASLDRILRPLCPGQLVVIGARPGMGKTTFAMNMAYHWAREGWPGLVFSLEMEERELTMRSLLAQMHTYNAEHLEDPESNPEAYRNALTELGRSVERVWDYPIFIDDRSGVSLAHMLAEARRMQRESVKQVGARLRYIIIDFMQLASPSQSSRGRNRADIMGEIVYEAANLAKELQVVVIALSQLNRDVEEETPFRPEMRHFLDGGKIEAAAHRALYLYQPSSYGDEEIVNAWCGDEQGRREIKKSGELLSAFAEPLREVVEIGILKQRNGGKRKRCSLHFDGPHYRFSELSDREQRALFGKEE